MFAINYHFGCILVLGLNKTVQKKLNRFQGLAVTSDDAATFLGVNLQHQISGFVLHLLNLEDESEITENGVE